MSSRRPRRHRGPKIAAAVVLGLLFVVALGLGILFGTSGGARWALGRVAGYLPAGTALEIGALRGSLRSPLILRNVELRSASMRIAIDRLEVRWRLAGLVRRRLTIDRLRVEGVDVTSLATSGATTKAQPPSLSSPVGIVIRDAVATRIAYRGTPQAPPMKISSVHLRGRLTGGQVRLDRLAVEADAASLATHGTITPQGDYPLDLTTGIRLAKGLAPGAPPLDLEGRLHGSLARLQVDQHVTGAAYRARLDATVEDALAAPRFRARLEIANLDPRAVVPTWPAASIHGVARAAGTPRHLVARAELGLGIPSEGHVEGELTLAGNLAQWVAGGHWQVAVAGVPSFPLRLALHGGTAGATLDHLQAEILGGTVDARGTIALKPALAWSGTVVSRGLEPQRRWPEFPGTISATLAGKGSADGPTFVRIERLAGTLRGHALAGNGALVKRGTSATLDRLDLRWGNAHLRASGDVFGPWDVTASAEVPDLAELLPDGSGAISFQGRFRGPVAEPSLVAKVTGRGLRLGTERVATLEVRSDLALGAKAPLALDLTATGIEAGGHALERVTVAAHGTTSRHRVRLTLASSRADARLEAVGGYANATWSGTLESSSVAAGAQGTWRQSRRAALRVGRSGGELGSTCWRSGRGAGVCAGGRLAGAQWQIGAQISRLPLAVARPFLPPDLELGGTLGGSVTARARGGALEARLALTASGVEVALPAAAGGTVRTRLDPVRIDGQAGAGGTSFDLHVGVPGSGAVTGSVRLPGFDRPALPPGAQPVAGRFDLRLADLSPLGAFLPQLDQPRGRLRGHFDLGGSVGSPQPNGTLALENGAAAVPALGIGLTQVAVAARTDGRPGFAVTARARSGGGTLTIAGRGSLSPSAAAPLDVHLEAHRFVVLDLAHQHAVADARLDLVDRGAAANLTGRVHIPSARIQIEPPKAGAVTTSDDVVFVGPAQPPQASSPKAPFALSAEVQVVLGEDIEVEALGFQGKPTGRLRIAEAPREPLRATGEIRFTSGSYKAYGQDLELEHARLLFAGPVTNPGIDARASRTASDGVVAGVDVTGTAEVPSVTLWSRPPMSESDQLAYVLFGHPLSQATQGEGSLMTRAASAMELKGGNLLAGKLASRFGLASAKLESQGGGFREASLVLGKYLSPKLFVSYGIGLFTPVSTVRIRYDLGKNWKLRAESGAATGADLLYTIETGGRRRHHHAAQRGEGPGG